MRADVLENVARFTRLLNKVELAISPLTTVTPETSENDVLID